MAALQPVDYITRAEAIAEIGRLVNEQSSAFNAASQQTTGPNGQTRALLAELREEVRVASTELRAETQANNGKLRAEAQSSVSVRGLRAHVYRESVWNFT